jgi:hypothetical protein
MVMRSAYTQRIVKTLIGAAAAVTVVVAVAAALLLASRGDADDASGPPRRNGVRGDGVVRATSTAEAGGDINATSTSPPGGQSANLPDCLNGESSFTESYPSYADARERAEEILGRPLPLPDDLPAYATSASAGEIRTLEEGEEPREGRIAGTRVTLSGDRPDPSIAIDYKLRPRCSFGRPDIDAVDVAGTDVSLDLRGPISVARFAIDDLFVEVAVVWAPDEPDDDVKRQELLDWASRVIASAGGP